MMNPRRIVLKLLLKVFGFGLVSLFGASLSLATEPQTTSSYIEYIKGNIPVIISVPHGGTKILYPNYLICGEYATDPYTDDLALAVKDAFMAKWNGKCPYIIINHLRRNYLDANRDPGPNYREERLNSATPYGQVDPDTDTVLNPSDIYAPVCTNSLNVWTALTAKNAWYAYNDAIDAAKRDVAAGFGNKGLYIDLHSYTPASGDTQKLFQLGYLLTDELNTVQALGSGLKTYCSLKYLQSGETLEELIRGNSSFGGILGGLLYAYRNYSQVYGGISNQCTPSPSYPRPSETDSPYNAGGWNTFYHTRVDLRYTRLSEGIYNENAPLPGHGGISGLQLEVPDVLLHDIWLYRKPNSIANLGKALADTIAEYLSLHYDYEM
jgi:hypothetical protein